MAIGCVIRVLQTEIEDKHILTQRIVVTNRPAYIQGAANESRAAFIIRFDAVAALLRITRSAAIGVSARNAAL